MIKNTLFFGSVVLLASLLVSGFIFAEKSTPDEAVKTYWQYLLEKNCKKIDEMNTDFTGYRKDVNGQIYQVTSETKVVGINSNNSSHCYVADEIELFGSKFFKILKSEVSEELRTATVTILTKDKYKFQHKYEFHVSKDPKDEDWKIIGFNMLIDEKEK